MRRTTLAKSVECEGVGLHSGEPVRLVLRPAAEGTGVVFVRADAEPPVRIPARPESVRSTRLATGLATGPTGVGTVEHLLAATFAFGVDDLRVDVHGPEVPILDGSAAPFAALLRHAGLRSGAAPRRVLRVLRPVEVRDGARRVRVEPAAGLTLGCAIDFAHPAIGRQEIELACLDAESFERELAPARTFGFLEDAGSLRAAGFARGAGPANTLVLDASGVAHGGPLRFADEFVRHKALDLLGDLALLGAGLQGSVRAERGGHALHLRLVRALLADPDAWSLEPAAVGSQARVSPVP